jgi:hypothetical protein
MMIDALRREAIALAAIGGAIGAIEARAELSMRPRWLSEARG